MRKIKETGEVLANATDWDEVWDNDMASRKFLLDPGTTKLALSCCDCGSTHMLDMEIVDGKIQIIITKDYACSKRLRTAHPHDYRLPIQEGMVSHDSICIHTGRR